MYLIFYTLFALVALTKAQKPAQCTISSDCDQNKECVDELCVDPCIGSCGTNAQCRVINHVPLCSCKMGHTGDPFSLCQVSTTTTPAPKVDACQPSPCGPFSVCTELNDQAVCTCEAGYIGQPPYCQPECTLSSQCAFDKACVNEKCVSPCIGSCGTDATCGVVTHIPICTCPPGYTGDPFSRCERIRVEAPTSSPPFSTSPPASSTTVKAPASGSCLLPPYPENGFYNTNILDAEPGQSHQLVIINVTCHRGFGVVGPSSTFCDHGYWPQEFPKCVQMCELSTHPSVEYRCLTAGFDEGYRPCTSREPSGTSVNPTCRRPNYYAPTTLHLMHCIGGTWNYIAKCNPECGKVTPEGVGLVAGGTAAKRGELPWHAGIYKKTFKPYKQVCGGSLISNNVVISAAHCFWNDISKQLPESQFAVAVGKINRPWDDPMDEAQKSDVLQIKLPPLFRGTATNFQDDVAVLKLTTSFEYKTFIRPVCLSFDIDIGILQVTGGPKGKIAGWGLTSANGKEASTLQVIDLPLVEPATCYEKLPYSFKEYLTSDKICAGYLESQTSLCKGDSGGGLAFPVIDRGTLRYYLHGVVSTAPNDENVKCNTATYTTFTNVAKHELFIKSYWNDI